MKKAEMQNLKVGQVVMDKRTSGEWTITDITDKNVTLDETVVRTMSTLQRWYVFVREPEVEVVESVEVPNLLVVPQQLLLPAPVVEEKPVERKIEIVEPIYNEQQIITDTKHLENYFVKSIIPRTNIEGNMEYEYTLINMHNNEEIIVAEVTIEAFFVLTTNEWNEKVQQAHKPVEEKPVAKTERQRVIDNITHGLITLDELEQISRNYGCEVKKCKHYTAVKFNGVSVVNIYSSKRKGIYPAFNHTIFTEEEIDALDEAQTIGNSKWVCDLKFKVISYEQYGEFLERAIANK